MTTPTAKNLNKILYATVTVTQKVTVPIVQTTTVSTTVTPKSYISKISLTPIDETVNVPRASPLPCADEEDPANYKYVFPSSGQIQVFLHSASSVLISLPAPISSLKVQVSQSGEEVPFAVIPLKRSPLVLVKWPARKSKAPVQVKLSSPDKTRTVTLDFSEPLIDPRVWELLDKSNREAWRRVKERMKEMQVPERMEEVRRRARKLHLQLAETADKKYNEMNSYAQKGAAGRVKQLFKRWQSAQEKHEKHMMRAAALAQDRMDELLRRARGQAMRLRRHFATKHLKCHAGKDGKGRVHISRTRRVWL
jgi:hypothetical protein